MGLYQCVSCRFGSDRTTKKLIVYPAVHKRKVKMSKRSRREREQVAWEIHKAKAKLAERKKLIEVLSRYLKQDEEQLEELMSSGRV